MTCKGASASMHGQARCYMQRLMLFANPLQLLACELRYLHSKLPCIDGSLEGFRGIAHLVSCL